MKTSPYKYMAIAWLLATSLSAEAAPYFTNMEGNPVWDKATGLVWMRCSVGQKWDGTTCSGDGSRFIFKNSRKGPVSLNASGGYGGHTDWAVPSIRQLLSLRQCTAGWSNTTKDLGDGEPPVSEECKVRSQDPKIDSSVFPDTTGSPSGTYWSSSLHNGDYYNGWRVDFFTGRVHHSTHAWGNSAFGVVRLVRALPLSVSDAALVFPVNLEEKRQIAENKERADRADAERKRADAERKAQIERQAAENKAQIERQAAENKARADRNQALKQLLALGPRGLYLEAGKAQRNGSASFVNTRFSASELYEMIVDKFPDSDYAVKATDQLTAMSRSSRDQSAAQSAVEQSNSNARERAYEACRIEMNSCYSRTNGKGNCYRDCERLR